MGKDEEGEGSQEEASEDGQSSVRIPYKQGIRSPQAGPHSLQNLAGPVPQVSHVNQQAGWLSGQPQPGAGLKRTCHR